MVYAVGSRAWRLWFLSICKCCLKIARRHPLAFHNAGARDFGQRWPVPNDGYYKNTVKILKSGDITLE